VSFATPAFSAKFKDSHFQTKLSAGLFSGSSSTNDLPPYKPVFSLSFITNFRLQELAKEGYNTKSISLPHNTVRVLVSPRAASTNMGMPAPFMKKSVLSSFPISQMEIKNKNKQVCKPTAKRSSKITQAVINQYATLLDYDFDTDYLGLTYLEYDYPSSCFEQDKLYIALDTKAAKVGRKNITRHAHKKLSSKTKKAILQN